MPGISSLIAVGGTHRGLVRARNEDSLFVLPEHGIAVVADGMGGHPGGDVASEIAARAAAEALRRAFGADPGSVGVELTPERRERAMRDSVLEAHQAILARARKDPSLRGMGTTASALVLDADDRRYILGNVGDSRVYLFRDGDLRQLTRDDTWIQDRVDSGGLSPDEASGHPMAHLLTQCLGLDQTPVPRVAEGEVRPGDLFLLCSDGLIACLDDVDIASILTDHPVDTEEAARSAVEALIDVANENGGVDNITVAIVAVDG